MNRMFERIKKINDASGSSMLKSNAKKSKKKMSKPNVRSEKKWKKLLRKTNPSSLETTNEAKARQNLTSPCTDNEVSGGDGPVTPNISRYFKKGPLRWIAVKQSNLSDSYLNIKINDSVASRPTN
ncbi:hypothetical protein HW555_003174 [Spodoptera exigua]|uniref:Uncharacterized protein n=1 Tax=Spodoptera exigua TaxID=7107 RepID=A0A835L6D8_SPOEX|nr:hypothetical protein HW555_003174 [Spodoptera exigua]